jgi:hypothetical protein
MLWEEMEKYTKLTGEDATHVPIMKLGAYLDGYDKGTEVLDKIRAEIEQIHLIGYATVNGKREIASRAVMQIIDKYKAESEGK